MARHRTSAHTMPAKQPRLDGRPLAPHLSVPGPRLRDTEGVPLAERVEAFFEREVKPHVPDAWIDTARRDSQEGQVGFVGYEIDFYRYTPPRPLEKVEADVRGITEEILGMLGEVTGGQGTS